MTLSVLTESDPTSVPGVRLLGIVVGVLLVLAAIRAMFGRRK